MLNTEMAPSNQVAEPGFISAKKGNAGDNNCQKDETDVKNCYGIRVWVKDQDACGFTDQELKACFNFPYKFHMLGIHF